MTDLLGPILIVTFAILMAVFALLERRRIVRGLRDIPAFSRLLHAVGLAVEDGNRVHITVGRGDLTSQKSAAAFIGFSVLERVARTASVSDNPPIATSGDGALSLLTRDGLQKAYREMEASNLYDPNAGRLAGVTPFSYAAGTIPMITDEEVSTTILTGHFGVEAALITDASDRTEGFTLAGTDSLPGQAVLFAAAQEPLIGEELYASGAYLRAGLLHNASLRAQDVLRWVIILIILGGGVLRFLGFSL